MTAISGSKAGFWVPTADDSQAATGEAMTRVGTTNEYYITDREKAWWDPDQPVTVYDDSVEVEGCQIDYAGGFVTLPEASSGDVTVDCYYFQMEQLAGGYGVSIDAKSNEADITCFSKALNSPVQWKRFISTLKEWTVTVKRHFVFAQAWHQTAFSTPNSNLVWTWKTPGPDGNLESITYVVSGYNTSLEVTRAAGVTTVTVGTDGSGNAITTAAQVKAHVDADPVLSELWDVQFASGENGTGIVECLTETDLHGGRDYDDLVKLGRKVLCCAYLDTTTGSIKKLEGVGILTGFSPDAKLDGLIENDLTFRGDDRLRYHMV